MYVGAFYNHTSVPNKRSMSLAKTSLLMRTYIWYHRERRKSPSARFWFYLGSILVLFGSASLCVLCFDMVPRWSRFIALTVSRFSWLSVVVLCGLHGSATVLLGFRRCSAWGFLQFPNPKKCQRKLSRILAGCWPGGSALVLPSEPTVPVERCGEHGRVGCKIPCSNIGEGWL